MAETTTKKHYLDIDGLGTFKGLMDTDHVAKIATAKSEAINASKITVDTTTTTSGMAKSYTLKQNGTAVTTIDIPKDMVVSSGKVVTNPTGQAAGTYLELTLANATNDKIYINVGTLVDVYTAQANATKVQLAINSTTREISATVVAGSITATELASDAVTTAKIADKNVTKAKLEQAVQTSLGKADSAVQAVTSGSANGTVAVDGTDVAVKGLGTAAYAATGAFDAAGTAQTKVDALANGTVKTNTDDITALKTKVDELEAGTVEAITDAEIQALFA